MTVVAMLQGSPECDRAATLAALELAKRLNVRLTGVCALPDPASAVMVVATPEAAGMTMGSLDGIIKMQDEILEKAKTAFDEAVSGGAHGLETNFRHEVNTVERAASDAATLAEAVVFTRSATKAGEPLSIAFEHVLIDARLPLVVAPNGDMASGPAIVAWDGSNGAARAVRFHLPLIKAMGEVVIAQNIKDAKRDDERRSSEPHKLQSWLEQFGVECRIADIEGEVASGLLALAKGSGASMIVAGAYGHSPLGERLFGGTTRRLLQADDAPMLALAR